MAEQSGIIQLKGTIGKITFVKTQDGYRARQKTSMDGQRIKSDPAFQRTRENGQEFGTSARAGKLLRQAVQPLMLNINGNRIASRITGLMSRIKNLDPTSTRGNRTIALGIQMVPAQALVKGFNFSHDAVLDAVLKAPFQLNPVTGQITFGNLVPLNNVIFPQGATHVQFSGAWIKLDFANGTKDVQVTNAVNLPLSGALSSNFALTPANVPVGSGTDLYLLKTEFFQEVNNVQYPLKDKSHNALSIIEMQ